MVKTPDPLEPDAHENGNDQLPSNEAPHQRDPAIESRRGFFKQAALGIGGIAAFLSTGGEADAQIDINQADDETKKKRETVKKEQKVRKEKEETELAPIPKFALGRGWEALQEVLQHIAFREVGGRGAGAVQAMVTSGRVAGRTEGDLQNLTNAAESTTNTTPQEAEVERAVNRLKSRNSRDLYNARYCQEIYRDIGLVGDWVTFLLNKPGAALNPLHGNMYGRIITGWMSFQALSGWVTGDRQKTAREKSNEDKELLQERIDATAASAKLSIQVAGGADKKKESKEEIRLAEEQKRETERLKLEKAREDALAVKEAERKLEAERHTNALNELDAQAVIAKEAEDRQRQADKERQDSEAIATQETAQFLQRRQTLQTLEGAGDPDDPANYSSLGFSADRIQQLIDASKNV